MALRPAILLPPKRLSTPRSAAKVSSDDWGLLPGAPMPTRTGLTPAGPGQLAARNMQSIRVRLFWSEPGQAARV